VNVIHLAAFNGHGYIICRLFTGDKSTVNHSDSIGMDVLKWESLRGHYETVQILLENGADVNTQGGFYGNALYAASRGGHVEVVKILLERGADVNAQGGEYGNALQAASQRGHLGIVQVLLEKGAIKNVKI
jgi:ankyrin repeat protein